MNKTYLQRGMTLIELMIGISIFAILVMIAGPNFVSQINKNKGLTLGEDFGSALNYARSEAIKRRHRVTLCPDGGEDKCVDNDLPSNWKNGWLVVVDGAPSDVSTDAVINNPATDILRRWSPSGDRSVYSIDRGRQLIRFTPTGTYAKTDDTWNKFVIGYWGCHGESAVEVVITAAGLVRSKKVTCEGQHDAFGVDGGGS